MNRFDLRKKLTYKEFVLKKSSSSQIEIIQRILMKSPHSTIFHSIEWNEILERFIRKKCIYGVAFDGQKPVGLIYFYLDNKKHILRSPHYAPIESLYGGPIVIPSYPINVASFLLTTINKKYCSFSRFIRTSPLIKVPGSIVSKGDSQMLTSLIDLTVGEEFFFKNLKRVVRKSIRAAQHRDAKVIEGKKEHIIQFCNMRSKTLSTEKGNDQIEVTLFEKYLKFGLEKELLRFLVALHGENIIAGAVFGIWNKRIYYNYAAFDRNLKYLYPNELILWEQIKWGMNNGFEILDMCHIEPLRYPGIAEFKMKFGGKTSTFYIITRKSLKDNMLGKLDKLKKLLSYSHARK